MSAELGQAFIILLSGVSFAALVLVLARRGLLTLRYTLGWLAVAGCVVALVALSSLVRPLAAAVGITPTGVLLAVASSILMLITLQITVTLSSLRDMVQTLTEANALLEERVVRIERSQDHAGPVA
jgi:signal transduction histidine kinase